MEESTIDRRHSLAGIKNVSDTITQLATTVDPGYFDGNLHHRGFCTACVMISALLWGLRRTETPVSAPVE